MNVTPQRVIWITSDHMRADCIGAYGNGAIRTPNLDYLVERGVNFRNCFAQSPVCMPSRAGFQTGFYPQQVGVTMNGHCLPADFQPTMATLFNAAGYNTVQIGKLHFQPHNDHDLDPTPRHRYGFDAFWPSEARGCYHDAWMTWLQSKFPEHLDAFRVTRATEAARGQEEKRGHAPDAPWEACQSAWIVDTAERYLRTHRSSCEFLHLGFHAPHPPLNPTREAVEPYLDAPIPPPVRGEAEWSDKPAPLSRMLQSRTDWTQQDFVEYRRYFYGLVTELDMAIGRLLDFLRHESMLDDTLIVFCSDHGDMCGDHGMTGKGSHFYDEVMRVPLVFFWPNGLGEERRDVDGLVELLDALPTMLDLCGKRSQRLAGRSYADALRNSDEVPTRDDVFAFHEPGFAMLRTEDWKLIRYSEDAEVLYDLHSSPSEMQNQAADQPKVLAEMRNRLLTRVLQASRSIRRRIHPF